MGCGTLLDNTARLYSSCQKCGLCAEHERFGVTLRCAAQKRYRYAAVGCGYTVVTESAESHAWSTGHCFGTGTDVGIAAENTTQKASYVPSMEVEKTR